MYELIGIYFIDLFWVTYKGGQPRGEQNKEVLLHNMLRLLIYGLSYRTLYYSTRLNSSLLPNALKKVCRLYIVG